MINRYLSTSRKQHIVIKVQDISWISVIGEDEAEGILSCRAIVGGAELLINLRPDELDGLIAAMELCD